MTTTTDAWTALDIVIERVFREQKRYVVEYLLAECDRDVYAETVAATGFDPVKPEVSA